MRAADFVGGGRGIQGGSRLADARPGPPQFATNFIPPAGRGLHPVLFPLRQPPCQLPPPSYRRTRSPADVARSSAGWRGNPAGDGRGGHCRMDGTRVQQAACAAQGPRATHTER
ncbi:hypothetical protein G6F22_007270 [Rhizopus arrhizus]|nr:hypothetical protein G6F22_007270 [Rhizopus arrhizus]